MQMTTLIRGLDSAPSLLGQGGGEITSRGLAESARRFACQWVDKGSLVASAPENRISSAVLFLPRCSHGHLAMLFAPGQPGLLAKIGALCALNQMFTTLDDTLLRHQCGRNERVARHPDAASLHLAPGTRGANKFFRASHGDRVSNADSIRQYLTVASPDRAVLSLPFHCFYGSSVLDIQLQAGASQTLNEPLPLLMNPGCIGVAVLGGRLPLVVVGHNDFNTSSSVGSLRGREHRSLRLLPSCRLGSPAGGSRNARLPKFQRQSSLGPTKFKAAKDSLIHPTKHVIHPPTVNT